MKRNLQAFIIYFFARRRFQLIYLMLYKLALKGMNYGAAAFEPKKSGEDALMKRLSKILPNNPVIFDVGSNVGQFAILIKSNMPQSYLHCFEPSKAAFDRLEKKLDNIFGCELNNFGISNQTGHFQLYSMEAGSVQASLNKDSGLTFRESVRLSTIDSYCHERNLTEIDFLKIDVEGHELFVLQGAADMLNNNKIKYIQFEFGNHQRFARHYLNDFHEILSNFRLYRILQDGVFPLQNSVFWELFPVTNYLAVHKDEIEKLNGKTKIFT
jgi:FkbM family methyltransferase